ncbi:kinase-like domain-containing protein [Rhizophagus clarus]|uniref:Kinase-like domain-containing protein n=1 Tax=Rhizophagus clarus TaxID=94130 RepID=A0A8H3L1K4_9GLOM|nr:kinase-like domain-containing protein [Rhizophagus clarus]
MLKVKSKMTKSYLTISNKWTSIDQCFGLTQNPPNGNYMLIIRKMDMDLRKYLRQSHNKLTWEKKSPNYL